MLEFAKELFTQLHGVKVHRPRIGTITYFDGDKTAKCALCNIEIHSYFFIDDDCGEGWTGWRGELPCR